MAIQGETAQSRVVRSEICIRSNRIAVNFLQIDSQVGLTFSGIALQAQDSEKRARNLRAARKAYDTVLRLMDKVTLTEDDAKSLARNLFQLKCELVMLGEVF